MLGCLPADCEVVTSNSKKSISRSTVNFLYYYQLKNIIIDEGINICIWILFP